MADIKQSLMFGFLGGAVLIAAGALSVTIGDMFEAWLETYAVAGSILWLTIDKVWDKHTDPKGELLSSILLWVAALTIAGLFAALNMDKTLSEAMTATAATVPVVVIAALFLAQESTYESYWPMLFCGVSIIIYVYRHGVPENPMHLLVPPWLWELGKAAFEFLQAFMSQVLKALGFPVGGGLVWFISRTKIRYPL